MKLVSIKKFRGEYDFLSNFYPCKVKFEGLTFDSAEAAFQAQKTLDEVERKKFINISASQAKSLGRKVKLRDDWQRKRIKTMLGVVRAKFSQNPALKKKLLETGSSKLVEGNTWGDDFWGICNGSGRNMLGIILMRVREELKEG